MMRCEPSKRQGQIVQRPHLLPRAKPKRAIALLRTCMKTDQSRVPTQPGSDTQCGVVSCEFSEGIEVLRGTLHQCVEDISKSTAASIFSRIAAVRCHGAPGTAKVYVKATSKPNATPRQTAVNGAGDPPSPTLR